MERVEERVGGRVERVLRDRDEHAGAAAHAARARVDHLQQRRDALTRAHTQVHVLRVARRAQRPHARRCTHDTAAALTTASEELLSVYI